MTNPDVPRQVERLLEALGAETEFREAIMGDLAEEYALRLRFDGQAAARRWYRREGRRVAPYLLRDWWRSLRWTSIGYFINVVLWPAVSVVALDAVLQRGIRDLYRSGMTYDAFRAPVGVAALMLSCTLVEGAIAGYIAARIGRQAAMPSALVFGAAATGLMMWSGLHAVPGWFLVANVTTMLAGALLGGAWRVRV